MIEGISYHTFEITDRFPGEIGSMGAYTHVTGKLCRAAIC